MADIKVDVQLIGQSRDEVGPAYDVRIDWVWPSLPAGATNPDGVETIVECDNGMDTETIRDEIRDAAIATLNALPGFASEGLTRGNVRVDGYSNEGVDDNSVPQGLITLYPGPPMRPNLPNLVNVLRLVGNIQALVRFDNTLNDDQKVDQMTTLVYFDDPPILTKLRYYVVALNPANDSWLWEAQLSLAGNVVSGTVDLNLGGQSVLWSTGDVKIALGLKRITGGYDIPPDATGRITSAYLAFQRF